MSMKCNNTCKIQPELSEKAIEVSSSCLEPWDLKCGPHISSPSVTWELVRNAASGGIYVCNYKIYIIVKLYITLEGTFKAFWFEFHSTDIKKESREGQWFATATQLGCQTWDLTPIFPSPVCLHMNCYEVRFPQISLSALELCFLYFFLKNRRAGLCMPIVF